ncbi:hypothetical protein OGM84_05975 [Pediococcus acidilactici]
MNILEAVEQKYPSLSRQERKIALKVIQHPSQVKKNEHRHPRQKS